MPYFHEFNGKGIGLRHNLKINAKDCHLITIPVIRLYIHEKRILSDSPCYLLSKISRPGFFS